jgi:hypothetical protein
MRKLMIAVLGLLAAQEAAAQNPFAESTRIEVGLGVTTPLLQGGTELMRARDLRADGFGYAPAGATEARSVGSYPMLFGASVNLEVYKPFRRIEGMMLGGAVRTSLTGSQPSTGGYDEGYFFNSISATAAAKYYPSSARPFFVKAELGAGSVLTKNRFRDEAGEQAFHHQFGIGVAGGIAAGYSVVTFGSGRTLDVQAVYQQLATRVEVDRIGNDRWTFGALHLVVSTGF